MDGETQEQSAVKPRSRRQRPGTACTECRRRKLRCDGVRPKCAVCLQSGVECEIVTEKAPRGPKKGYMQALKDRIALLESRLASRDLEGIFGDEYSSERGASTSAAMSPEPLQSPYFTDLASRYSFNMFASNMAPPVDLAPHFPDNSPSYLSQFLAQSLKATESSSCFAVEPDIQYGNINFSHFHQAELDQTFFDRIQPSVPMLHQRHYLSWSRQPHKSTSQKALQYAVWTLASLVSPQAHNTYEKLYNAAKRAIESASKPGDVSNHSAQSIELVQAILLVSIYESMKGFYDTAWMSAGRAFRMMQLMRLHKIDESVQDPFLDQPEQIRKEEMRRTFWMAYLLDNMFAIRGNWSVALTEKMIFTRLPMPEAEFQNEQPVEMDFLVDAVMEPIPQQRSSFSESLIFVTICSRSLSQSVSTTSSMIRDVAQSGWDYSQDPLADEPPPRMHFLWHFDSPTAHTPDPMLILANVLAQVSVILLYRCFSESGLDNAVLSAEKRAEGRSRALAAADRIVDATAELPKLHYSRLHPLLPMLLRLNAEFLCANASTVPAEQSLTKFQHYLGGLRVFDDTTQTFTEFLGISHLLDKLVMPTIE